MNVQSLWSMSNGELARVLAAGHPIDPARLCGSYRGVSLGLPRWVDRVAWKVFRKVFEADGDQVSGHNVRLRQTPEVEPVGSTIAEPMRAGGAPIVFGPFRVRPLLADGPFGCRSGVLLDYGAAHPPWHPLARLRDPLVAVEAGSEALLLGASYLQLGVRLRTPSFFTLEREPEA